MTRDREKNSPVILTSRRSFKSSPIFFKLQENILKRKKNVLESFFERTKQQYRIYLRKQPKHKIKYLLKYQAETSRYVFFSVAVKENMRRFMYFRFTHVGP